MSLNDIGEFGLIKKLSEGCLIRESEVLKGIGDDAGIFLHPAGEAVVVTTDMMVERIHFLRNATSGFNLGYKCLAVNLSDIAAMGASAREAFISIAIPEDCSIEFIEDIYNGMKHLAASFQVNLLGGDTTGSRKDLVINVVVVGSAPKEELLYRCGAKTGDIIFSTGYLGDSRAGCYLIINEITTESEAFRMLKKVHLLPRPCIPEGRFLARCKGVHAAIDVSDGLCSDLGHILEQSNVGAKIYSEKIPISENLEAFCQHFQFDPVQYAITGGEDYTLLFTASRGQADNIINSYQENFNRPIYEIGEINDSNQLELEFPDGNKEQVHIVGWDHFKKIRAAKVGS